MHVHLHSVIQHYLGQCVRNASPIPINGISVILAQSARFTTGAKTLWAACKSEHFNLAASLRCTSPYLCEDWVLLRVSSQSVRSGWPGCGEMSASRRLISSSSKSQEGIRKHFTNPCRFHRSFLGLVCTDSTARSSMMGNEAPSVSMASRCKEVLLCWKALTLYHLYQQHRFPARAPTPSINIHDNLQNCCQFYMWMTRNATNTPSDKSVDVCVSVCTRARPHPPAQ